MYYFVYYIKILLTRGSRLNLPFKKRTRCDSFMALNRAGDMSEADWLSQSNKREKLSITVNHARGPFRRLEPKGKGKNIGIGTTIT